MPYASTSQTFLSLLRFLRRCDPTRAMAPSVLRLLDHAQRCTTVGRTPLDEWSSSRIDFCLTTHNTRNWQTSMPTAEFEPIISAGEWPQIYVSDRFGEWDLCDVSYRGHNDQTLVRNGISNRRLSWDFFGSYRASVGLLTEFSRHPVLIRKRPISNKYHLLFRLI